MNQENNIIHMEIKILVSENRKGEHLKNEAIQKFYLEKEELKKRVEEANKNNMALYEANNLVINDIARLKKQLEEKDKELSEVNAVILRMNAAWYKNNKISASLLTDNAKLREALERISNTTYDSETNGDVWPDEIAKEVLKGGE